MSPSSTCDHVELGDGAQIFCRHAGLQHAGRPLILLHGNRDNHSHFAELESLLSQQHRTVAIDFRGHGFSSQLDGPLSPDVFASDLDQIIQHYGWDEVILAGHSLGAVTSMVFGVRFPGRVSRLILMGAAAHYERQWQRPPVTEATYPEVIKESNKRAGPYFFLDEYPAVNRRVLASWSRVPFLVHKNLIELKHPDLRPQVPNLKMPVLVIAGERDRSTPVESARWISDHLPNGRLEVVAAAGHFMFMEKPEVVAGLIARFLRPGEIGKVVPSILDGGLPLL